MLIKRILAALTASVTAAVMLSPAALAAKETESYTEDTLTAHIACDGTTKDIPCRYYKNCPDVPYIKLTEFYQTLTGREIVLVEQQKGTYTAATVSLISAEIDTEADTITSTSMTTFLSLAEEEVSVLVDVTDFDDGGAQNTVKLELGKYGIDLHDGGGDIWMPAPTLCDLFKAPDQYSGFSYSEIFFFDNTVSDDSYADMLTTDDQRALPIQLRTEDFARFSYNELCFVVDNFYGFPGRIPLNDVLKEKGLDGMLESNESAKSVKEMLLSEYYSDYLIGLIALDRYMYDGGHTVFDPFVSMPALQYSREFIKDVSDSGVTEMELEGSTNYENEQRSVMHISTNIQKAREKATGEKNNYKSRYFVKRDTAFFCFDEFDCDYTAWEAFYKGEGKRPDDLPAEIVEALKKADSDPAVKNFVFDISANTGGLQLLALFIDSLICDDPKDYYYDTLEGCDVNFSFDGDRNLDGVFDEKDKEVKYDLRYAVMCSGFSFSCSNLLPSLAKDAGILVLGQHSAGGSCAVNMYSTADGIQFYLSGTTRLCNSNKENIDGGIEPDIVIETPSKNFDSFYDGELISAAFEKFYSSGQDDSSDTSSRDSSSVSDSSSDADSSDASSKTDSSKAVSESESSEDASSESESSPKAESSSASERSSSKESGGSSSGSILLLVAVNGAGLLAAIILAVYTVSRKKNTNRKDNENV